MPFPLAETLGLTGTLAVAALGYWQWRRTQRSGSYLQDRTAAYKEVWDALEEINLYVRRGQFDKERFDALVREANTRIIKHGLHVAEKDRDLAAAYMRALEAVGEVLSQPGVDVAFKQVQDDMAVTASGKLLPTGMADVYRDAIQEMERSRKRVIDSFRRMIGAGQI